MRALFATTTSSARVFDGKRSSSVAATETSKLTEKSIDADLTACSLRTPAKLTRTILATSNRFAVKPWEMLGCENDADRDARVFT